MMKLDNEKRQHDQEEYALGVDLGGSKIGVAVVSPEGRIIHYSKAPTLVEMGKDDTIARIKANIRQVIEQSGVKMNQITGIGVGAPGPLSPLEGIIYSAPNLPGWHDVPLAQILEEEFDLPVILENDGNAAAWGERIFGAARGINDLICLTLGTGIGGGLILGGKIYHGKNCFAGEIGHMVVNKDGPRCNCGGYGCLESYSSATGIRNRIAARIEKMQETIPDSVSISDLNEVGLADIFQRARHGDPLLSEIVSDAIEYLGIGITSLVNLLNPEMVVLVGGITNEGDQLLNPIKDTVFHRAMKSNLMDLQIVIGQLGNYAGVTGSAALMWKSG